MGPARPRVSLLLVWVMALFGIIAFFGSVWLWRATALAMWHTFIASHHGADLFAFRPDASWQEIFVHLDLSTFTSIICVLLTFFVMVRGGWLAFLPRRDRSFWSRAYFHRVFPARTGTLAVRLGLIGTLLSFVLAALTMIRDLQNTAPRADAPGPPVAQPVRVTAGDKATRRADILARPEIATVNDAGGRREQTSQRIFLLLCASLIHTLAGCVAAYMIIPSIEGVNALAMGRHLAQREPVPEPEDALRGLAAVIEQITQVTKLLGDAAAMLKHAADSAGAFSKLGDQLQILVTATQKTSDGLGQSATTLSNVGTKLGDVAAALDTSCQHLKEMPESFDRPIGALGAAANNLGKLAEMAAQAQNELAGAANAVRGPTEVMVGVFRSLLALLKNQLPSLIAMQTAKNEDLKKTRDAFDLLARRLGELTDRFEKLSADSGPHQGYR